MNASCAAPGLRASNRTEANFAPENLHYGLEMKAIARIWAQHVSLSATERDNTWLRTADRAVVAGPERQKRITGSKQAQARRDLHQMEIPIFGRNQIVSK